MLVEASAEREVLTVWHLYLQTRECGIGFGADERLLKDEGVDRKIVGWRLWRYLLQVI